MEIDDDSYEPVENIKLPIKKVMDNAETVSMVLKLGIVV